MKKVVSSAPQLGQTGSFRPSIMPNGKPTPMAMPLSAGPVAGPVMTGADGSQSQQLAQMGIPMVPGMPIPQAGQTITVNMNAPSPHLPMKEWMLRGVVGGLGHVLAFPFLLIRDAVQHSMKLVFKAIGILLIPTLLMAGCQLRYMVERANSGEQGAQTVIEQGRHVLRGIGKGASSDLDAPKAKVKDATTGAKHGKERAAEAAR